MFYIGLELNGHPRFIGLIFSKNEKYARILPSTSVDWNKYISNSHHTPTKTGRKSNMQCVRIFVTPPPILFLAVYASSVNYRILRRVCRLYLCTKWCTKWLQINQAYCEMTLQMNINFIVVLLVSNMVQNDLKVGIF